jgi:ubiquinone biosynthesis protein
VIPETVSHLRDIPRYGQILTTLVRYGYQDVVTALHLEGIARPIERVALGNALPQHDRPHRLRLVCEDLGPTFVKLGQLLSTRPDLLPEAYTSELAFLRDDVRTFPFGQVESILRDEYGQSPGQIFASLDEKPVASASISQVHRAVLHDGRVVALKVQRPDIAKVVQADLDIIKNLAHLIERRIPNLAVYRPLALAREFERTIKRELDFSRERRTIERCRLQFGDDCSVHIPLTFPDLSTTRVLAMEFVEGVPINDLEGIRLMGSTPEKIAAAGARLLLKQIFEFGFFHGDPHPGNLRVLPSGLIVPLDYGVFGHLDIRTRERIAGLLSGLLSQDADRVIRALESLEIRREHTDARGFRRDVAELVTAYSDLSLDSIDLGVLLRDLTGIIRTHRLSIPPDLILLIRALVTIESVGRGLDPHFDIAALLHPFLRDEMRRRFKPDRILSQTVRTSEDLRRIATLIPDLLSQSLESIKRGELRVVFDLQGFERMVRQLTRASNSLTLGIVIAGLFVSSSLLFRVGQTTLAYLGFTLAVTLGAALGWNMTRGS